MDEYTKNFWNRMGKLEEQLMRGEDPFGFTDEQARKLIGQHNERVSNVRAIKDTQVGIIKYAEAMAQVLAEAAIASQEAIGDSPNVALIKWLNVIEERARVLIKEKQGSAPKAIDKGTVIDG